MTNPAPEFKTIRPDRQPILSVLKQIAPTGVYAEIGTYRGDFALDILEFCAPTKFYCVDPYKSYEGFKDAINFESMDDIYAEAKRKLAPYGERVEFLRMTSEEAAVQFPDDSLDFIYIDGNHSYPYVMQDLELWFPKIRQTGMLCGDDAVDGVTDKERNADGDVVHIWSRDAKGEPLSWGHYGVCKAVMDFTKKQGIQFFFSGTQFMIFKKGVRVEVK
jgi:predicted O-methyltransferase YrrM